MFKTTVPSNSKPVSNPQKNPIDAIVPLVGNSDFGSFEFKPENFRLLTSEDGLTDYVYKSGYHQLFCVFMPLANSINLGSVISWESTSRAGGVFGVQDIVYGWEE